MNLYDLIETPKETIESIIQHKNLHYSSYPISKSNGKHRWIDAPGEELKAIQGKILGNVLYKFAPHRAAMGFRTGVGVADSARLHLENNILLCMDLSNFFHTIKKARVLRLMTHLAKRLQARIDYLEITSEEVEQLVELVTFKGRLPQGAPTSPALANLVCINLDKRLSAFAKMHEITYTRYADDLSFSHPSVNYDIYQRILSITGIIREEHFRLNYKKTRVSRPHKRMVVTGVVINDKLGVPKYKWRNFRAKLHNYTRDGIKVSKEEYQQLRGYAEWIRTLNPKRGEQFLQSLNQLQLMPH